MCMSVYILPASLSVDYKRHQLMCMTIKSKIKEAVQGNRSVWVLAIW